MEPKFPYGKKVYIKMGFYRGYQAEIKSYSEVKVKNTLTEEEETTILYKVKIENVVLKDLYEVREDWLIPYRKYMIF